MAEIDKLHVTNLSDVKHIISDFIAETYKGYVKDDRERLSDTITLFASTKTIGQKNFNALQEFYRHNRLQFFRIIATFERDKFEYFFNQIYAVDDSPRWLITIVEELGDCIEQLKPSANAEELTILKTLRHQCRAYFSKIFNYQYLVIREYNANNTPVNLLKYIAAKEGVHPASHWSSFEERLNRPDHFLLGLEHFKMPNLPAVYIEIALSRGLIRKIHHIIGDNPVATDIAKADTAIFYSVNNTFKGLNGIGLGEKMIIRATRYLNKSYPQITRFATLSPVPGFRAYLDAVLSGKKTSHALSRAMLDDNKKHAFFPKAFIDTVKPEIKKLAPELNRLTNTDVLAAILTSSQWHTNRVLADALELPLINLTRYYLLHEQEKVGKSETPEFHALDPVANFHLSNGAMIGSINVLANLSERGFNESYGMMCNYLYDLDQLDDNKLKYSRGEIISKA